MFYIILYSLLAFGSQLLLSTSQSLATNIIVVFSVIVIYLMMGKRYIAEFGGIEKFKIYFKKLMNINVVEVNNEKDYINSFDLNIQDKHENENSTEIVNFEDRDCIEKECGDLVIGDSRFSINAKKWLFLFYIFNTVQIFLVYLSDWSFYLVSIFTLILSGVLVLPILIESWHGLKKTGWKKTLFWIVSGTLIILALNFANAIFFNLVSFETDISANQLLVETMIKENFMRFAFEGTLIAAIYEELIFRGIIFRGFINKNRTLAYVVTFFAFGLPHLIIGFKTAGFSELMFLPIYGLMGVVFACVYDKTNSIYTAMGVHFANNLISFLLILGQ